MLQEMEGKGRNSVQGSTPYYNDPVKCNYMITCSGEIGMELIDKWEIERKIHDANRNNINRYFELFEEHIAPNQMP